jgi:hypothetical protein
MGRWTRSQVEAFAPDARSVAAARKLARPGPWSDTGSTDSLLWGKCQGSGATPYQVSVDLTGPAAKCSCPSRKFPCKHGIALLLLWSDGDGVIPDADDAAGFASDWAQGRADQAAQRTAKRAARRAGEEPADPEARDKRLARRIDLMTRALEDLELWLGDLYRQGAAAAKTRGYAFWDDAASRLVDGQVPSLAERVREMPSLLVRPDWADAFVVETGRWFLAARSWARRQSLDEVDLANLRTYLGWSFNQDEVRATPPIDDRWIVEGVHRSDDGRLQAQRTWLRGERSDQRVVVLDFASVGGSLGIAHVVGSVIGTPLHLYPGSGVRRGLFATDPTATPATGGLGPVTGHDGLVARWAEQLAANPFELRLPVTVTGRCHVVDDQVSLVDEAGRVLPLITGEDQWSLLATVGPDVTTMFGELEDSALRPLTVAVAGEVVPL